MLALSLLSTIDHLSSEASCFNLPAVNKNPTHTGLGAASLTPTQPGRGALEESLGSPEDVQIGLPQVSVWRLASRLPESGHLALPDFALTVHLQTCPQPLPSGSLVPVI